MAGIYSHRKWATLRQYVLDRDGWVCQICGGVIDGAPRTPRGASVDHVIELARGGARWDPNNLRAVHVSCNSRKAVDRRRGYPPRPRW